MKNVLTIIKKELKRFFTDPRMILALVLPGIIMMVMYTAIGAIIESVQKKTTYAIITVNKPETVASSEFSLGLDAFHKSLPGNVVDIGDTNKEYVLEQIEKGDVDLLVVYEDDFWNAVEAYNSAVPGAIAPKVELYFNSSKEKSSQVYSMYSRFLDDLETKMIDVNKFDIDLKDTAKPTDLGIMLISMILPGMLVIFLSTGSMSVVTESIAGEKERGTIAALLVTPIKRSELALGKATALSIASLASGLSSFIGMIVSLPSMMAGVELEMSMYSVGDYFAVFAILIATVMLVTIIMCMLSAMAKSVKEATGFTGPIMLVVVAAAFPTMFSTNSI
jgi:sodium transport system permease protein